MRKNGDLVHIHHVEKHLTFCAVANSSSCELLFERLDGFGADISTFPRTLLVYQRAGRVSHRRLAG